MPRSSKLPVLNLLTDQKSGFSPRRGDSLHRLKSVGRADGHVGPLGCAKFRPNGQGGGGNAFPQNIKNFHFLVKSRPVGATPLTDFENFYGLYYAQLSYSSGSNFM